MAELKLVNKVGTRLTIPDRATNSKETNIESVVITMFLLL
jgi:hypothetical protein